MTSRCDLAEIGARGPLRRTALCGLYNFWPTGGECFSDPDLARSRARHLGGVNLGFLDGHAAWASSRALIANVADGTWEGIPVDGPSSACGANELYPGVEFIF
ncbi:MAG: hypothetical protein MUQ26_09080 [Armatimonadetes bacterium]|nr:hypothetical protein [Armatimonadota bacterium]